MNLIILPLRAIVSEFLILLMVIAIESYFFQLRLNFIPKVSIQYATVINLISTCVGWIFFFYGVSILPNKLEEQIVAYILFGKIENIYHLFILAIFVIFLTSLILKLVGFNLCEYLWNGKPQNNRISISLSQPLREIMTPKFMVITMAHICSYLAIWFILLLQRFELT
ncbi:filament integrity protein FraC [Okeania sp.]|uniref:filament integrity protein FraC n=1 Tax=Okeania sp. TaxID=3100323 RepID=UPI002B4AAF68|nr:filament integrity protein FraC [Okeania sp.]MEB3341545.1 hypothetical protein [Okeania sp.]